VQEVLPAVTGTPLLMDLTALADPDRAGQLLASRLVYRQLGRGAGWLLPPVAVALLLRIPLVVHALSRSDELAHLQRWLLIEAVGLVLDVALVAGLAWLIARTVYAALAGSRLGPRGAQLFVPVIRRSWLELDVQHELRARLLVADTPTGELTLPERLVLRRSRPRPTSPQVVAEVPGHASWPVREPGLVSRAERDRVRRIAAIAASAVGVISVLSAVTLPLGLRLRGLLELLPIELPQTAAAGVVFVGTALLLLARGLRRGASLAWAIAVALLAATAVLHLLKGIDVEESLIALGVRLAGQASRGLPGAPGRPAVAAHGWGLGLNFAVQRAVLAGEYPGGLITDLHRAVLQRFSESMQIESLWRYNQKFASPGGRGTYCWPIWPWRSCRGWRWRAPRANCRWSVGCWVVGRRRPSAPVR
jgi:hypothetical protein